jgi:hypothetical protein
MTSPSVKIQIGQKKTAIIYFIFEALAFPWQFNALVTLLGGFIHTLFHVLKQRINSFLIDLSLVYSIEDGRIDINCIFVNSFSVYVHSNSKNRWHSPKQFLILIV